MCQELIVVAITVCGLSFWSDVNVALAQTNDSTADQLEPIPQDADQQTAACCGGLSDAQAIAEIVAIAQKYWWTGRRDFALEVYMGLWRVYAVDVLPESLKGMNDDE